MEDDRQKLSLMSSFLKDKIKEKGLTIKKFAEQTGLSERYVYKLISDKRDATPNDETLESIFKVLELSEKDRKYLLDLAIKERETGNIIYEESVPVQMSVLSGFIKQKIRDQWGCIKDFARKADVNNTYIYDILSVKRDFTLTDKTLRKFLNVLRLSDEEKNFVFIVAKKEREIGNIIYPGDIPSELIPHSSLPPLSEDSQDSLVSEDSQDSLAQVISKEFRLSRLKGEEIIKKIKDIITNDISFVKELGLEEMFVKFLRKVSFKTKSPETCPIDDIIIHEQYLNTQPKREQIQEIIEYYKKYRKLDKPLTIQRSMFLIDGYKRYIAAKELGLNEVEAKFVSKPWLQVKQQEKKKVIVPKGKHQKGILAENLGGKIKRVEYGQGYGFINGEDEEVYFFHHTSLKGVVIDRLEVEYRVIFDVKNSPKGPIAINIREDI